MVQSPFRFGCKAHHNFFPPPSFPYSGLFIRYPPSSHVAGGGGVTIGRMDASAAEAHDLLENSYGIQDSGAAHLFVTVTCEIGYMISDKPFFTHGAGVFALSVVCAHTSALLVDKHAG